MQFNEIDRICYPEKRIFISRDHNWAFAAWEIGRIRSYIQAGATIIHIDSHLDFAEPQYEVRNIDSEGEAIKFGQKLQIDEFIIPAQSNGTIGEVLIISDDSERLYEETAVQRAFTLNHYEHEYRSKWYEDTNGKSVILDLDLDFFNYNKDYDGEGILPTEENMKKLDRLHLIGQLL